MSESKPGTLKLGKGELVAILQALGAEDAEGWADSQLNEDIPQLARFLFLRSAWKHVLNKGDIAWIENACLIVRNQVFVVGNLSVGIPATPEKVEAIRRQRSFGWACRPSRRCRSKDGRVLCDRSFPGTFRW